MEEVFKVIMLEFSGRPIFVITPIVAFFGLDYLRRLKKYYYTPVYFPFVFENINPIIARYYGSNTMQYDCAAEDDEVAEISKNLKTNAAVSFLISSVLLPLFVGWISCVIVSRQEFILAAALIILIRFEQILRSIIDYDVYSIGFKNRKLIVSTISFLCLLISGFLLFKGYFDSIQFVRIGDWWGYFKSFFEVAIMNIAVQGVIIGLLVSVLSPIVLDDNIRRGRKVEILKVSDADAE